MLDEEFSPFADVDVYVLFDVNFSSIKAIIDKWERSIMILHSYPFACTQTFGWSENVIHGYHLDPANTLGRGKVVLNTPVDKGYKPTKP